VPETPLTLTETAEPEDKNKGFEETAMESTSFNDGKGGGQVTKLGNGDASGLTMGHLLLSASGDATSAKKSVWESRNLRLITGPNSAFSDHQTAARAYGFVKTAYSATGGDELNLAVGDLVYLDTKLEHAETKKIWICGEVSVGCEKRAGLFPLDVVEVIIDL